MKLKSAGFKVVLAALGMACGTLANAAIIDNGTYTTDTDLGIDYLDVGLLANTYANFSAGVDFGGRTWTLASASQLASTWSDATGLALTAGDIFSGDNNMTAAATTTLLNLFDGVADVGDAGERVAGDFSLSGYYNFIISGSLALHSVFDDSHFQADTSGRHGAWLVSATQPTSVPEPASLAVLSLGLLGVAAGRRLRNKSKV